MKTDLVERYWVNTPELFEKRTTEIVGLYPDKIHAFELCKNDVGDSLPCLRLGRGSKHIFVIGGEHGHEPVGMCGLTAVIEGIASGTVPGTDEPFPEAAGILETMTLHIVPMMNPDGSRRFAAQVNDSFPGTNFGYNQEDSDQWRIIQLEPGITQTIDKVRPAHYTEAEMAAWRETGKSLGTMFTENGVELYMDWDHDKAVQTRAVKKLMEQFPPSLFVDVHAWQCGTMMMMPQTGEEQTAEHVKLANCLYDALEAQGLPFDGHRRVPDTGDQMRDSAHWVHDTYHVPGFIYEIHNGFIWYNPERPNMKIPGLSQEDIIMSVWYGITALLKALGDKAEG